MTKYLAIGALILALIGGGYGWYQSSVATQAAQRAERAESALAVAKAARADAEAAQAISDARVAASLTRERHLSATLLQIQSEADANDPCIFDPGFLNDLRGGVQ